MVISSDERRSRTFVSGSISHMLAGFPVWPVTAYAVKDGG
jgi:hypothetical protein